MEQNNLMHDEFDSDSDRFFVYYPYVRNMPHFYSFVIRIKEAKELVQQGLLKNDPILVNQAWEIGMSCMAEVHGNWEKEVAYIREKCVERKVQLKECEAKLEVLEQVYADVRKAFAEFKLKHTECTVNIVNLKVANSTVTRLEQSVIEQTSNIKNLESQFKELQLSNAHNVGTVNLLNKQNSELQQKVTSLELERASMQERIRVLEAQQQEDPAEKPRHGSAARRRARYLRSQQQETPVVRPQVWEQHLTPPAQNAYPVYHKSSHSQNTYYRPY